MIFVFRYFSMKQNNATASGNLAWAFEQGKGVK
jgi:hypothetical protein